MNGYVIFSEINKNLSHDLQHTFVMFYEKSKYLLYSEILILYWHLGSRLGQ